MRGILFDINVQGHSDYLLRLFEALGLWAFWTPLKLEFLTVSGLGYPSEVPDRVIWNRCQSERLILFTDNRNVDGQDSLGKTLSDSLTEESFPVLTIANKRRFERDRRYALIVAEKVLENLIDIADGEYRGVGRLSIPPRPIV